MSETTNQQQEFQIQRIFIKDVSFESPNAPGIFQKDWKPEINLDMDTRSNKLADGVFEVTLALTVTAKVGEETAFLCEVQQSGIFTVGALVDVQLAHCLGAFCPNILFPYARETITNMVSRGTFPQLNLAPVNFDALFSQYMQQQQSKQAAEAEEQAEPKLDS